jgi:hypothetical protein
MTSVDVLHRLVDDLPERQHEVAARLLQGLRDDRVDPLLAALLAAPDEDEDVSAEETEGAREALEEYRAGLGRPWEDVRRELAGG